MNNKEFISALARRTGYKNEDTNRMVRSVLQDVTEQLVNGESVMIARLGSFDVKKRMERIINNPATGQRMLVPPKLVINFKPMLSAKELINQEN